MFRNTRGSFLPWQRQIPRKPMNRSHFEKCQSRSTRRNRLLLIVERKKHTACTFGTGSCIGLLIASVNKEAIWEMSHSLCTKYSLESQKRDLDVCLPQVCLSLYQRVLYASIPTSERKLNQSATLSNRENWSCVTVLNCQLSHLSNRRQFVLKIKITRIHLISRY